MGSGEWTDAHGRYAEKSELVAFARSRTRVTLQLLVRSRLPLVFLFTVTPEGVMWSMNEPFIRIRQLS